MKKLKKILSEAKKFASKYKRPILGFSLCSLGFMIGRCVEKRRIKKRIAKKKNK